MEFFRYYNFYRRHLTVGIVDGKLQITSLPHENYIVLTQEKLNQLSQTKSREQFIKLALTEAMSGCNYVIFSVAGNDSMFIQFLTGNGKLKFYFYANENNRLGRYFYPILGVLAEFWFVDSENRLYKGRSWYVIQKVKKVISIDASFGKNIDQAVKFSEIIFKKIYKIGTKKIVAKVE